jgi:hypothetical protein
MSSNLNRFGELWCVCLNVLGRSGVDRLESRIMEGDSPVCDWVACLCDLNAGVGLLGSAA